ncbi:hypothetical protein L0337_29090 [candidate division KSB1 bacterium]|nr:hypothetical protein [candidate division KSB1 bacterium]
MEPVLFLDVAKKFLSIPSEAAYRSAVSRAYYAVFHAAASFLEKLGFKRTKGPQEHGEIPARFNNCGVADGEKIASWLNDLHRQRILADYDLKSDQFAAQFKVAFWIAKAEQAILTLNTLSASQNICTQIRKGIQAYEEKLKAYQGALK